MPTNLPHKSESIIAHPQITKMPLPAILPLAGDYTKSEKPKRPRFSGVPRPAAVFPTSAWFSAVCLLVGTAGILLSTYALLRPRPAPVLRCGWSSRRDQLAHSRPANDSLSDRPKLLGFVGIQTGFGSADRRAALRSTWLPSDHDVLLRLERATGLAFRFVIGRTKNEKKMSELVTEIEKYDDFFLIDVREEYLNLPHKTLAYFKAAYDQFEADYYVKIDDDIYLRPDRLSTLLAKERSHPYTYIGCMKKGPVVTDPKMKWYEKSGNMIGNEYFLHAYGPIYALSAEVVASLTAIRDTSLRMFNNEDVTVGSWMLALNVEHEDNRAICDPRCTSSSIAVWDIPKCSGLCEPTKRLKELHKMPMCSKSPTLPPDDR